MTRRLIVVDGGRAHSAHAPAGRGYTQEDDGTFTIDVHRVRTPHFDLRLIRDDSVSMWAVASPIPARGDGAQSAIRIDELPIAVYDGIASRSDRAPWDDGRMTVRSWIEGEAAVVTLHGAAGGGLGGTRTLSLLHVGAVWRDDDHWTIVAVDDASCPANTAGSTRPRDRAPAPAGVPRSGRAAGTPASG